MVYLTSHGPTKSCENGNWPNVTVTVTNWDEKALSASKSEDEETLEAPRLSCQEEQRSSSQLAERNRRVITDVMSGAKVELKK